ncbi:hypothetical protein [Janthinobacterium fluminis]|uniref:Uncharacterized protein n=1 Tax=Janthinobacterium fluminis TaxID=2987524 RepID=A0ABT5JWS0_9BURK|nr:hypothetical protein [Janthinobacterium fluminis]MDC8755982.1 hypothetical protein [Janthinobacterium fluminis]
MHPYLSYFAFAAILAAGGNAVAQPSPVSMYSDISGTACARHIDDASTGAYTMDCPGVHGFRLRVLEDDERSSISIVTPNKRVFPLNYWNVVTRGFSMLGTKAEWRIAKVDGKTAPIAIIVRIHALDQSYPEHPKRVPLLAVAKISRDAACVTRAVEALAPDANEQARRFADNRNMACLPAESGQ